MKMLMVGGAMILALLTTRIPCLLSTFVGVASPGSLILPPVYHILLCIFRENLAAKVGNFDEVHGFIVNLLVNSHKMKGSGMPLDVMDFLYNELYFGVIEKCSCPFAPFVMNLGETQHFEHDLP
jgi:hypothetical protein